MRTTTLLAATISGLLLTACTGEATPDESRPNTTLEALDSSLSLTPDGVDLLDGSRFADEAPRMHVDAEADPLTGRVAGTVSARLPVGSEESALRFRYFAGLASFKADAAVGEVTVDGSTARAELDKGLVTVPLTAGHDADVTVSLPFSYTLPEAEEPDLLSALGGESLSPAEVGLLARWPDRLSLGHWFPMWLPPGVRADADPKGYGDISNFAAADLSLALTVPDGWSVIDGGVRVDESSADGSTTITSYGTGMRDLSVAVVRGYTNRSRDVGEVTLTAWSPEGDDGVLDEVLDETEAAVTKLSEVLGGYPWREFDVISTPLGGAVAGMEWPGATWIESAAFAGGIPGLGELGSMLGPLLGDGELGTLLSTTRPWTIAHEVAHIWWTILVGNDSIAAPVVDEPLAQYSACLVMRATRDDADEVCEANIVSGYGAMAAAGDKDAPADQASDEFASPTQYGGVVYGKAAWFYLALEREFGADELAAALRSIVAENAFSTLDGPGLRAGLAVALGERAGPLWDRWMEQVHGDEDMPESDLDLGGLGGLEGLEGLEGLDPELLEELLGMLDQLGSS